MHAICEQFTFINQESGEYLLRLIVAAVLSLLIGLEREMHGRAAGVRTSILVGIGSALFMILSITISSQYGGANADPGRIAAQIVTGIGFLGAGTILKFGVNIRGLTTAACMWIVASIGMAAGAGFYQLAVFVTAMTLLCLLGFVLVSRFIPFHSYRTLRIKKTDDPDFENIISLVKRHVKLQSVEFELDYDKKEYILKVNVRIFKRGTTDAIFKRLNLDLCQSHSNIVTVNWSR